MKKENICSARPYTTSDGQEKTRWRAVGELITFNSGKQKIEWFANPNVDYVVFEQKRRNASPAEETVAPF